MSFCVSCRAIIVFMVVNNSHLTTPLQQGHQDQLACTTITTHTMLLLSMHKLVVTKLKVLEFKIPKWCNTPIYLSIMALQLGFCHFLLQSQLLLPFLPPQVKTEMTLFQILYCKPSNQIWIISRGFDYMQILVIGVTAATGVTGASATNSEHNSSS